MVDIVTFVKIGSFTPELLPWTVIGNYTTKAIWAYCDMNFIFSQSYVQQSFLTIVHDCPVPVGKHNSFKTLPHPLSS